MKYESPNIFNSIGKTITSKKPSAAYATFGTAPRKNIEKLYLSKELDKGNMAGITSPSPDKYECYNKDKIHFKKFPAARIGNEPRDTLGTNRYDYYNRHDTDYEPH